MGGLGNFHVESLGGFFRNYTLCKNSEKSSHSTAHWKEKAKWCPVWLLAVRSKTGKQSSTGSCCGVYKIWSMVIQFTFKGVVTVSILLASPINSTIFSRDRLLSAMPTIPSVRPWKCLQFLKHVQMELFKNRQSSIFLQNAVNLFDCRPISSLVGHMCFDSAHQI